MKTTLKTGGTENYTQNKWEWKLHSKRVGLKTTVKTSENENYTQNEWNYGPPSTAWLYRSSLFTLTLHSNSKRVGMKTTLKTSEIEN
jgi:hypothetical protein